MASRKTRYRVTARHAITDDRGRQFGPGEEITDLDVKGSEQNERLLASGSIVAVTKRRSSATPAGN